jgi:hypothetical protein
MKRELRGKKFGSDQRSAARLSRSGWRVVRASLAKYFEKETVTAPPQISDSE